MNMQGITQKLQGVVTDEYTWSLHFFTTKKSRDGAEFSFGTCSMKDIGILAEGIRVSLLEKAFKERAATEYTPFITKENIGTLPLDSELVHDPIADILLGIENAAACRPDEYAAGLHPWPTGYVLQGVKEDSEEKILYIRRTNPFIRPDKSRICIAEDGSIVTSTAPVLKFLPAIDLLVAFGHCYMISDSMNKDLGIEARHYAICAKHMELIADKTLINNYEQLEAVAMSGKHVRKFLDFDRDILLYIDRLSILEREEFLATYGITIDNDGRMDTFDKEQCELIVDLLCCRSCVDPLGRLAVANGISPRE